MEASLLADVHIELAVELVMLFALGEIVERNVLEAALVLTMGVPPSVAHPGSRKAMVGVTL